MSDAIAAPFQRRFLSVEIIVPKGIKKLNYQTQQQETSELAGQRISLQNYRIDASVVSLGKITAVSAGISIYNLPPKLMRALAGYGTMGVFNYASDSAADIAAASKTVAVRLYTSPDTYDTLAQSGGAVAQQTANQRQMIFRGSLQNCSIQMDAVPDPFAFIQCNTLGASQLFPADALSYKGAIAASTIAQQIAQSVGLTFVNDGVTTVLQNPCFHGDLKKQLRDLSEQALFDYSTENGTLAIWPIGSHRSAASAAGYTTINSSNGLIDYPQFNGVGVSFTMLYNPAIRFGDRIYLETDAPNATGYYVVSRVEANLSQELPGGPWYSNIQATSYSNPIGTTAL